jgi:molybdenum cofactor synthesis domain-containing protein
MFGLAVLTVSTSGYQGQREDTSGQAIKDILTAPDYEVVRYEIVSDEQETIAQRMAQWADDPQVDLIVSTGGTGLGPRDVTPEACLSIIDREVPGLAETMRAETLKFTPMAMLSRSVAGIRGKTLIITLPGSPKGVRETLEVVKPVLPHALELLKRESVSEHPL